MKEDYVSFKIAEPLKEKGFHELCHCNYHCDGFFYQHKEKDYNGKNYEKLDSEWYSAPTLQMAMKWLRERYNIHITIDCDICDSFDFYSIIRIKSEESWKTYVEYEDEGSNTYEEAVEKAIEYCLTNLI